jgi:nitroreductase
VVTGLVLLAFTGQLLITGPGVWAQDQATGSAAPPPAAAEIKVPRGTQNAVTAILKRRSIREYTPHPVPEELVRLLLEAGMAAPSAMDERSTEFVVITDRKILDAIHQFNTKRPQLKMASVAILVCGNRQREKNKELNFWLMDGSVAAENILVAAQALGLGAVWTAIYPFQDRVAKTQQLLNLPESVMPLCIIPVGYPAERKITGSRFEASRAHYNAW